jgi:polyphosphate kinase 2 (PPK2 family)
MFAAKPHPLLVPFEGTFAVRDAPTEPPKDKDKDHWQERLDDEAKALGEAQYRLYADARYAVLLVFQALDAAGKDGTIRHVFAGVNPCGLRVASFKRPSPLELAHDFLWRTTGQLPERGTVAIFNRSYYEEVIVVRVHPQFLAAQRLPEAPSPTFWDDRLRAIADHERHLAEQGTVILKFWLNVTKLEHLKRLIDRIHEPTKNTKYNYVDLD